jgi:hypothetical protein
MTSPITITSGSATVPAVGGRALRPVSTYVTSETDSAFIKEQNIGIYATGLRPSTQLYVFFDGVRVSSYVTPATLDFTIVSPATADFIPSGVRGGTTSTNSDGTFSAIFYLPAVTFYTGERQVIIADVDNLNSIAAATTSASFTYHSFNHFTTSAVLSNVISTRPVNNYQTPSTSLTNNPIAQSFYVGADDLNGADGIFATGVDLYFQTKDPIQGITVDIRTMQDGVPTQTVLPLSSIYVPSGSVNISNTAATATHIAFDSPVFLSKEHFYSICITPNGNNPNYKIYTAAVGEIDISNDNPVYKNWGSGDLFTSTNGFTWVPVPNEFLKFTLNRAEFTSVANSSVSLVNDDYEFFTLKNAYGTFEQGEYVFKNGSNLAFSNATSSTSNVSINSTTYTVSLGLLGTITAGSSLSQFTANQKIVVSNGSNHDVLTINSVTNTSSMTIKNYSKLTGNVVVQKTPVGRIYNFEVAKASLTLVDSTASNTSFLFAANDTLIGTQSLANTQILVVRDRIINRFAPFFHNTTFPTATLDFKLLNTIGQTYANTDFSSRSPSQYNYIVDSEVVVSSKSSEILNRNGVKSFIANIAMTSNSSFISPAIDLHSSSILATRNMISYSAGLENTKHGQALNKYISKTISLTSGLDSEDLIVYLDAYKPINTDIKVYGKFLAAEDPDVFDAKDWTLLDEDTPASVYSDPVNLSSVYEFKYVVPTSPSSTAKSGIVTTSTGSSTITGINTSFNTDVAINDLVKIYSDSSKLTFQIAKVTAIANSTSMTLDNNPSFTSSSASYEKIDYPRSAFLNNQNGNILRYYSSTGAAYNTFLTYAIKIVLLADYTYRVPRVLNLRSIAVT